MVHIGVYLKKIRTDWGKSLKEVSNYCGVSLDFLSKVERGDRKPTSELLKGISSFYSVPYDKLLEIYLSDEIVEILDKVEDPNRLLKITRKRIIDPNYQFHIPNSKPLKKEKSKRKYVKGGKNGKIKGFNFYIQPTGKLIKREREELLIKSEEYMTSTIGTELDPSLSDIELMEEWNEFFDEYGMRFPEFKDNWIKENPIPEEMGDKEGNSNSEKKKKIELPDILKTKDSLRSNLG